MRNLSPKELNDLLVWLLLFLLSLILLYIGSGCAALPPGTAFHHEPFTAVENPGTYWYTPLK